MFYHHNTIRTYTGALLNLFNDLEVQYKNSVGEITSRNIPVRFASKEKSKILDDVVIKTKYQTLAVKAASNKAIYDEILQKLEELDKWIEMK